MARTYNYFAYTRDDGETVCSIRLADDIADSAGLGFGGPSAANPPPPLHHKPRQVYLLHPATGRKRAVSVATPAAYGALLNTPGATVSLFSVTEAAAQNWGVVGGRGERVRPPHLIH